MCVSAAVSLYLSGPLHDVAVPEASKGGEELRHRARTQAPTVGGFHGFLTAATTASSSSLSPSPPSPPSSSAPAVARRLRLVPVAGPVASAAESTSAGRATAATA